MTQTQVKISENVSYLEKMLQREEIENETK